MFITAKISFIFTSFSAVQIYDFHIFTVVYSPLHVFIWNQHNDQLPFGRALHRYRRGHGFKSRTGLNLFRPYFHYCSSIVHYCEDLFHDFHTFTVVYSSLYGLIWNQHNDQLSVGLLTQLVERCRGIAEVMDSNPVQA